MAATAPAPHGLTLAQIAGRHWKTYDEHYKSVDPGNSGRVNAPEAAKFLKRSGLSDVILGKIWDLSDPAANGFLDKGGIFVSLKLISLAQNGRKVEVPCLLEDMDPPKLSAGAAGPGPVVPPAPVISKPPEIPQNNNQSKSAVLFNKFAINGKVPSSVAREIFMESKLNIEKLGQIWDLSDRDRDGELNFEEFSVAIGLIEEEVKKMAAAVILPPIPELNDELKTKYSGLFNKLDEDKDGFVNGAEIKETFLQTGLSQPVLAQIWNLCDTDQHGKLNREEFTLAMFLIERKLTNASFDIPNTLDDKTRLFLKPPNPEFVLIGNEVKELAEEREKLQCEIIGKETEKRIKSGEVSSLSSELDNLAATLKQLETQRNLANTKLGELEAQVINLRGQASEQGEMLSKQEGENAEKLSEITALDREEAEIEASILRVERENENIKESLSNLNLQVSSSKSKLDNLSILKETMEMLLEKFNTCLKSEDFLSITETELRDLSLEMEEFLHEPEIIEENHHYSHEEEGDSNANFPTAFDKSPGGFGDDPFTSGSNAAFGSSAFHQPSAGGFSSWDAPAHDPFAPVSKPGVIQDYSPGKDPFGAEPFNAPALPPKKSGPPPRPAPPKNVPARPPPPGFGNKPAVPPAPVVSSQMEVPEVDQNFADFAQFDAFGSSGSPMTSFSANFSANFSNGNPKKSPNKSLQNNNLNKNNNKNDQSHLARLGLDFTEDPFKNYRYDYFQGSENDPFK